MAKFNTFSTTEKEMIRTLSMMTLAATLTLAMGCDGSLSEMAQELEEPQQGQDQELVDNEFPEEAYAGLTDSSGAEAIDEESDDNKADRFEGLSDEAKGVFETLRSEKKALFESARDICSHDRDLMDQIKGEIKVVRDDEALDRTAKRDAVKAILEANRAELEADKAAFQACRAENQEALTDIKEQAKFLTSQCLPAKPEGVKGKRPGKKMKKGLAGKGIKGPKNRGAKKGKEGKERPPLSDEQLAAFETTLVSDECSQALGQ